jgi:uncharacterized membrane protein YedE/YeeE
VKAHLAAFGAGSLFAIGLAISGMTKPSKVTDFLDVAGPWDPSLGLVMAAAVAVGFVGYRWIRRRTTPLFDVKFHLPTRRDIDPRLVLGTALFGIGWGLGGLCPGPALVAGAGGVPTAAAFVGAMTIGMLIEHALSRAVAHRAHRASPGATKGQTARRKRGRIFATRETRAELHPLDKKLGEPS